MNSRGVLYLVVSGAPAAAEAESFVALARGAGWLVRVIATPMGLRFVNHDRLSELTGGPVRTEFRMPHETSNGLPAAHAVVVAPATFNTINKWALGIADNVAVAMLCELVGYGIPILAVPELKPELAKHVAFARSLDLLRSMGVEVLFDEAAPPASGMSSWKDILAKLHEILDD